MSDKNTLFQDILDGVLNIDPVYWAEKNLNLDGKKFRLSGNGYKPFADIYRYIGIKALEKDSKPIVMVKGRQVGATTMASVLELYFMASGYFGKDGRPPMRVMHCFPQLDLAFAYTKTKLNTMINTAEPFDGGAVVRKAGKTSTVIDCKLDKSMQANDSLQFKQFEGGNHIWIESTGFNGDRIRGKTLDSMFFDECQDMRADAINNSKQVLSKAQYGRQGNGIQVYFGTPKQSGTDYWRMWQRSSKQYYHLGCGKCKEYFPLYTPGSNEWENIWLHGFIVRCTKCGFEQNKLDAAERGKWIASNNDPDCDFIGYHINQLYNPEFTKEKVVGEKPENHPTNTERAYQNEVLGEFFAGSAAPITPEEIHAMCADPGRKFAANIGKSDNKRIYLGADWGDLVDIGQLGSGEGKRTQGKSYSCVVVLSSDGPNILNIEFATRLKRNDPETKREIIEQMFRQYSVDVAVGDIGYAGDLSHILQREFGDKYIASRAVGQIKNHAKYVTDVFPTEIQFDREYYIELAFNMMKKGKIKFPYGDFEKVAWLINHCTSVEMKPSVDRAGEIRTRYVKGSTPNDGLMALINGILAYFYDVTNGFKITNPSNMSNMAENKKILAVTGYVPRL